MLHRLARPPRPPAPRLRVGIPPRYAQLTPAAPNPALRASCCCRAGRGGLAPPAPRPAAAFGPLRGEGCNYFFNLTLALKGGMKSFAMISMPLTPPPAVLPFDPPLPPSKEDQAHSRAVYLTNLALCDLSVDQAFTVADRTRETCYYHESRVDNWMTIATELTTGAPDVSYATVANFNACGSRAWVQFSPSRGKHRVRFKSCGLLLCPTCGPRKAARKATQIAAWMGDIKPFQWRMFTLSLPSTDNPLVAQIEELKKAFRRLRQTRIFADTQNHGAAIVEVTFNLTTGQWHPHIHALMRGDWVQVDALRAAWWSAAKCEARIHLRVVDSSRKAAGYVTKYLGKGMKLTEVINGKNIDAKSADLEQLPREKLAEFINARCRKKWLFQIGECEGFPEFEYTGDDEGPNDWQLVDSLRGLALRARTDPAAAAICLELQLPFDG